MYTGIYIFVKKRGVRYMSIIGFYGKTDFDLLCGFKSNAKLKKSWFRILNFYLTLLKL